MTDREQDPAAVVRNAFSEFWDAARGSESRSRSGDGGAEQIRSALSRLIDLQMEVAQRVVTAQIDFLAERIQPRRSSIDPVDRIEVKVEQGGEVTTTIWLHNVTAAPLTLVVFGAGSLAAASGGVLPRTTVRFDPPAIEDVEADSVLATTVSVRVPIDAVPDVYHGFVFVAGRDDVAGHLVVTVIDVARDADG